MQCIRDFYCSDNALYNFTFYLLTYVDTQGVMCCETVAILKCNTGIEIHTVVEPGLEYLLNLHNTETAQSSMSHNTASLSINNGRTVHICMT